MKLVDLLNLESCGEGEESWRQISVAVEQDRKSLTVYSKGLAEWEYDTADFSFDELAKQLSEARTAKYFPDFKEALARLHPELLADGPQDQSYFQLRQFRYDGDGSRLLQLVQSLKPDLNYCPDIPGCSPLLIDGVPMGVKVTRALLDAGADPNIRDACGNTAAHRAVYFDEQVILHALLMAGAAVDPLNTTGWTPLSLAVQRCRPGAARILLDAGADPFAGGIPAILVRETFRGYNQDEVTVMKTMIREAQARRASARNIERLDRLNLPKRGGFRL